MITRCPECGTKFRISVDIIRAEDSTVRCGDCMAVFDARAQLVDEATESSYLADSAKERAARLRQQQQQADQQYQHDAQPGYDRRAPRRTTDAHGEGRDGAYDGHGANWVEPGWDSADQSNLSAEAVAERFKSRPRGQLIIDRRESEADIDLDDADTIAYTPVRPHGDNYTAEDAVRAQQQATDAELSGIPAQQHRGGVATDYAQRIDPLIDPDVAVSDASAAGGVIDDKAIEFEKTLALENLTGIEPGYFEDDPSRHSAIEKSVENRGQYATETAGTGAGTTVGDYVGEHQFATPAADSSAADAMVPRTRLKTRDAYTNDPDIVDPPSAPPRSERHLADYYRDSQAQTAGSVAADPYAPQQGDGNSQYYAEHHSPQGSPGQAAGTQERPDRTQSATAMRQHVTERGVAIDTDDDQEEVREGGSGLLGWLLVGLIAALCAGAFFARDNIAQSNLPQSVRAAFCAVAGCQLPVATDISELQLLRQKVYSHPSIDGALVVSIDVVNNAVFPQPYPVLAITMANSAGEAVAQRDFEPSAYLENYSGDETLVAGKPTRINIDIVDPGDDAQSFEMEFRQQ